MREFLKVMLWDKEIGRLAWHEGRKLSYFNYNPEFIRENLDVAPLVASIRNPMSTRAIFGETERIYQKLPSFIADSLPDAWGNQLFEHWRRQNHISGHNVTPLEKLAFIGKRGMGALEFIPEIDRGLVIDNINIKALADLAEKIQNERENIRIEADEELTLHSLIAVGTSAGGRQPKGIIAINPKTGVIRSGQIETDPDFEYYILKFGNKERSTAELEQTYYEMALMAGINMMESRLMCVEGVKHFLTKRFDRDQTGKLHTQTLAAIYPEADSYEQLLTVCRKLHLPEVDCQEVFRRLVFNILANNTDDHNKNFTFLMDKKGVWRLSPAYDMTYIFDTGGYLPNKEHCLMIGGKLQDITHDDIISFAAECGIRQPESIIRKVTAAISSFRELAQRNNVREEWIGRVENCLNQHLSAWGYVPKEQSFAFSIDGHKVTATHIEAVYKGNYHLLATIDGRQLKYVLRTGTDAHEAITSKGLSNLTENELRLLVEKYLLPKII
ncbi:MAG: type II toxin-antitoxin system HipA family toxin [Prevotella sp.]|nr:type II toxin-antitoxin system HipA family toxin [Prevotella sp.]